jgi:hypothetical protein
MLFGGALVAREGMGFREVVAVVVVAVGGPFGIVEPDGFRASPDLGAARLGRFFVDDRRGLLG